MILLRNLGKKEWIIFVKNDYRFFRKAKVVSSISDYDKVHIGCVAVYHNRIIGIGCNCNKTHPAQGYYNRYRFCSYNMLPKLHAEINCINQIRRMNIDFSKVKMYIYRARKDREYGLARPCPSCMAAIKDIGIKNIYYTSNDGFVYERVGTDGGDCNL